MQKYIEDSKSTKNDLKIPGFYQNRNFISSFKGYKTALCDVRILILLTKHSSKQTVHVWAVNVDLKYKHNIGAQLFMLQAMCMT
jgi:hypothetical protein